MCVEVHVTAGPARGRSFLFEKPGHLLFGRAPEAQISVPDDPYVSRQHFELVITPPTCILRDLHSTNGVFINGVHYGGQATLQSSPAGTNHPKEVVLDDGDEIVVRETRISISIKSSSSYEPATQTLMRSKSALIDREVALLLVSIPQSLPSTDSQDKTLLSSLIGTILTQIKRHASSKDLLFLKYLDKGLLMAFPEVLTAFILANDLFGSLPLMDEPIRMALHWGSVRTRPNGDVFGREVHRVYRIGSIEFERQRPQPVSALQKNFLVITQSGLHQLAATDQQRFILAGTFHLEGFDEMCELWVLSEARK